MKKEWVSRGIVNYALVDTVVVRNLFILQIHAKYHVPAWHHHHPSRSHRVEGKVAEKQELQLVVLYSSFTVHQIQVSFLLYNFGSSNLLSFNENLRFMWCSLGWGTRRIQLLADSFCTSKGVDCGPDQHHPAGHLHPPHQPYHHVSSCWSEFLVRLVQPGLWPDVVQRLWQGGRMVFAALAPRLECLQADSVNSGSPS